MKLGIRLEQVVLVARVGDRYCNLCGGFATAQGTARTPQANAHKRTSRHTAHARAETTPR
jgi:hypothetical protein